jgi:hypothetical protein
MLGNKFFRKAVFLLFLMGIVAGGYLAFGPTPAFAGCSPCGPSECIIQAPTGGQLYCYSIGSCIDWYGVWYGCEMRSNGCPSFEPGC